MHRIVEHAKEKQDQMSLASGRSGKLSQQDVHIEMMDIANRDLNERKRASGSYEESKKYAKFEDEIHISEEPEQPQPVVVKKSPLSNPN